MLTFSRRHISDRETLEGLLLMNGLEQFVTQDGGQARVDWDRLNVEELVKQFGADRVYLAIATSAERDNIGRVHLSNSPTRIFISYRHADQAIHDWVARLHADLSSRGYEVLLDFATTDLGPNQLGRQLAEFVAMVSQVDVFLQIVTRAYSEGASRPWIFREREAALRYAVYGHLAIINVRLEDCPFPDPWSEFFPTADLRDDPADFSRIHAVLPPVGVALTPEKRSELVKLLQTCRTGGNPAKEDCSAAIARLIADPQAMQVREAQEAVYFAHQRLGRAAEVIELGKVVGERFARRTDQLAALVKNFHERSCNAEALALLDVYRRTTGSRGIVAAHLLTADILEDMGSYEAAVNHFAQVVNLVLNSGGDSWASDTEIQQIAEGMLGRAAVHLKMGDTLTAAKALSFLKEQFGDSPLGLIVGTALKHLNEGEVFEAQYVINVSARRRRGKNREPQVPLVRPREKQLHCRQCGARYAFDPAEDRLCGGCGSRYKWTFTEIPVLGQCPYCLSTGHSLAGFLFSPHGKDSKSVGCPICRLPSLERAIEPS